MKKKKILNEDSNYLLSEERKKINAVANSISITSVTIYILLLIVIEYVKSAHISYKLFSIFFISELAKAFYKYVKIKDKLYLLESMGCIISIIALFVLMI